MELLSDLPPVFDLWQLPLLGSGESVAFGPPGAPTAEEAAPIWRMDLPADPGVAQEQLSRAEAQVEAADRALETIPSQLEELVRRAGNRSGGSVDFTPAPAGGASGHPISPSEREVLGWIAAADPSQVDFGAPGGRRGGLEQASSEIRQAVDRLLHLLLHLAWVETQVQGQLVARTVVGWSGDLGTAWQLATTAELFDLHRRALRLALAARLTMLRTLIVVTQGAVKLSALIAAPGGALLALPVAWKYVNQVLLELKNYAEISRGKEEV